MKDLIELHKFTEKDFGNLISEISDARFLLQWAGPKYTYPLDGAQLSKTLADSQGEKPTYQMFKAKNGDTAETVGHIQLMDIDYSTSSCVLGRVLIFQKYRGRGYGCAMVRNAVKFAFEHISMTEVKLGVFDFNLPAIKAYKKIGFREVQFKKHARQFNSEWWNVIRMKLTQSQLSDKKH